MKLLRTLLAGAALMALLAACGSGQESAAQPQEGSAPAPAPRETQPDGKDASAPAQAVIDGKDLGEEVTVIKDSADGLPLLSVSIIRPDVEGLVSASAQKAIDRYYDDLYRKEREWWSGELVEFAKEHKKAAADYGGDFLPYSVMESNEIVFENEEFLSVKRDSDVYTGGAHGSHSVACENFRKKDGSRVKLGELFRVEDFKPVLLDKVADRITAEQRGSKDDAGYYDNWNTLIDDCFDEECYYLGSEALTVVYQPYDVAPYAAGVRYFPIAYAEISNELSEPFLRAVYGGKK